MNNLANISQAEKDEMQLHLQECKARFDVKGMDKHQVERYMEQQVEPLKSHLKKLKQLKEAKK
jgi:flagellar motor component MotA